MKDKLCINTAGISLVVKLLSVVSILGGIGMLLTGQLGGIVIIAIFISALTFKAGIEFDLIKKRYREFNSILGIHFGKWNDLSLYPDLVVVKRRLRSRTSARAGMTMLEEFYDAVMVTENHLKKVPIKSFDTKEEALNEAPILAHQLGLEYTDFNPRVSSSTRARR